MNIILMSRFLSRMKYSKISELIKRLEKKFLNSKTFIIIEYNYFMIIFLQFCCKKFNNMLKNEHILCQRMNIKLLITKM